MDQTAFEALSKKIREKRAVVGIFGLGYVGLPLIIRFADAGFRAIGFDIDANKVKALSSGKSYIEHIPESAIVDCVARGVEFTTEYSKVEQCDAAIICVPTPLNKFRDPDLSYVTSTLDSIRPYLRKGQLVSLESTTYPGTTNEEVVSRCESAGFKVGEDVFVVYSPEREDPGNARYSTQTIPKLLGGVTALCSEIGESLYSMVIDQVVVVSSPAVAEMAKLLENIQRAVNIGLANEMKLVADKMGIDIFEIVEAAATKPFGFSAYYPGPGLGGHCIPVDPYYMMQRAADVGVPAELITAARAVNRTMPLHVAGVLNEILYKAGVPSGEGKILLLGWSYKAEVGDPRETPAEPLAEALQAKNIAISAFDPHLRPEDFPAGIEVVEDINSAQGYDLAVLVTAHQACLEIDYIGLAKRMNNPILYDGRRVLDLAKLENEGWQIHAVGRP